jgi:hypothetical protein
LLLFKINLGSVAKNLAFLQNRESFHSYHPKNWTEGKYYGLKVQGKIFSTQPLFFFSCAIMP